MKGLVVARGMHREPHRGQRLHALLTLNESRVVVGLEGQLPRRGGWYLVAIIRWPRLRLPVALVAAVLSVATLVAAIKVALTSEQPAAIVASFALTCLAAGLMVLAAYKATAR